ncbi:cation/copper resistance transporter ATPase CopZ [Neoasaia chiangmaiensis NBRC 101099]|uniref:Uncharacterized protein n=1 Tax=Neoasaia chiangmaiensis TaxID=320497 RepID=A0A1U9KQI5_9PROT|nr:heavy-metal-associated domain-containing protein [Neoasaia chiangmaiensis]AQS88063.1 hypothetical protein A0U93_09025 [Neoasaia chiangmaiensis]GBR38756.1 cation/copper resistance transporter ATPase CopZ [Neoasaia chiangmaiensis NBRC 101099]GEN15741.1 hypothetical protein NCH01_21720 [Neoasaia chiangmaiensis]
MSETVTIKVEGMSCGGCSSRLAKTLSAIDGVASADVSHEAGTAVVAYDPARTRPQALHDAIEDAGFDVAV